MFRRLSEPLPLSEASLLALRPALNAPVLNVGFLPVGPARAAIVAFGEEWGGIGLALGIRSNEGGQVAVFRNQETIEPDVSVTTALEPILAEAERMGFLFDEDMVASASTDGDGRTRALALWGRLMGELDLPPAPRAVPAEPAASESILLGDEPPKSTPLPPAQPVESNAPLPPAQPVESNAPLPPARSPETPTPAAVADSDELVLDDRVPELDLGIEGVVLSDGDAAVPPLDSTADDAVRPPPDVSQETQPMVAEPGDERLPSRAEGAATRAEDSAPPQKLSKFRHADEALESSPDTTAGGNQLGRIPLKRVRRESGTGKKPSTLARLLASF